MAGKISEMSDASTLDGSEQLEVVQGGSNFKVTVNDLLPVQLQEDKSVGLNGHSFQFIESDSYLFITSNDYDVHLRDGTSAADMSCISQTGDSVNFYLNAQEGVLNPARIHGNGRTSSIQYEADTHTFNGVINIPIQSAPGSPNDGDIWREDNTNTGLKIRINGVTKTITVS